VIICLWFPIKNSESATIGMQTLHRSSSRLSSFWILTLSRYGLGSGSRFHCNADPDPAYQNNVNLAPQLWFKRRPVRLTLEVLEMKQYSGFVTFWYGSGSDVLYHISGSGTVRWKNCCFKDWIWVEGCSVADPNPDLDPSVPFVFGHPISGSGSISYWYWSKSVTGSTSGSGSL
jgi:hypothetical protein